MNPLPEYPVAQVFSRQQVAERVGIADDVLGYWMKEGLLVPIPLEGARRHRRFAYQQLHVAGLLNELRKFGVNIAGLRGFAALLQRGIAVGSQFAMHCSALDIAASLSRLLHRYAAGEVVEVSAGLTYDEDMKLILAGRSSETRRPAIDELEIILEYGRSDYASPDEIAAVAKQIAADDVIPVKLYADLILQEHLADRGGTGHGSGWDAFGWLAWPDSAYRWTVVEPESGLGSVKGSNLARSAVYLNLSAIVHDIWLPRVPFAAAA
ncbi:MerR family transcriptional regulator [Sphingomonas sp. CFBP 8764]|uniref:MerR family transcriptional regulator n=1 Tax=Sphingomonas sp. CFBP 8764 TaxID=2775275 RepID=UPI001781AA1F|nr:MerR family transcriptional regulator [Sphingomonas sp. CFBP 8764]MBD8552361.1 MerR family transcriptional regulator [Sphingomonas sp. CFBP 8764]